MQAQVPQGFNYQAVALDANGQPLQSTTLPVRIGITTDPGGTNFLWEEQHSSVVTNNQGLFSLVFGNPSATKTAGTATSFSQINWSATPLYIRTKIFYNGDWQNMGGTQLWSVPYSMVAGRSTEFDSFFTFNGDTIIIKNPVSIGPGDARKAILAVTGKDDDSEDPLFEVRRRDGQPVFSVYSEGVRVYVGEGSSKASKGGFAVGSFEESKGIRDLLIVNRDSVRVYIDNNDNKAIKGGFAVGSFEESKARTQDYLRISHDSIRMYIDDNPGKAIKGGFAVGSFEESKRIGSSYFDILPVATTTVNPSEPRILWYPLKNAFLAGQVLIKDPEGVGLNSLSIGYETSAQGEYSQALGYRSSALKINSTAIGKHAKADGKNSFALGDSAIVTGDDAYAIGAGARATGRGSFAIGSKDRLFGDNFILSTSATGDLSMASGLNAKAIGNESYASGIDVTATGEYSVAIGRSAHAQELLSMAIGGTASGMGSLSIKGNAIGMSSLSIMGGTASGWQSTSISGGEASGDYSLAIGNSTAATGNYSVAVGGNITAQAYGSFVTGYYNVIEGNATTSLATDPLFVIGNGTFLSRSNALTVLKNGRVAIGHNQPTQMLDINGQIRIRGGSPAAGRVLTSSADGTATWAAITVPGHTHAATDITSGTLTVARGGTGQATLTSGKVLVGAGTGGVLSPSDLHWDNTNNRLGLGTAAPADNMHIASASGPVKIRMQGSSSNSSIEFRTGATYVGAFGANHADNYIFIYTTDNVSFRNGRVGIGNTNPVEKLDITNGNGRVGVGYQWLTSSDARYKTNVTNLAGVLDKVALLRGVRYDIAGEPDIRTGMGRHIGFIAQELELLYPELVVTDKDGYKAVAYDKMTAILVEAFKEQQKEIEAYRSSVEALQSEVELMKSELSAIRQLLTNGQK